MMFGVVLVMVVLWGVKMLSLVWVWLCLCGVLKVLVMCWVVILFIGIGSVFGGVICDSVYSVCGVCVYGLFYSIFVSMVRMVSISSCIS